MEDHRPILIIEDDTDSVELLRGAFKKAGLKRPLRALPDGEAAIAYLSRQGPYQDPEENPRPCLLILDLKLPCKSGIDVLAWLKSKVHFRSLPVVMITSSSAKADIEEAFRLGIDSYCVKPLAFEDLVKFARAIRRRVEGEETPSEDPLHAADPGR